MAGGEAHRNHSESPDDAPERIQAALKRYQRSMDELNRRTEESGLRLGDLEVAEAARHDRLMWRWERSENLFVEAISEINTEFSAEMRRIAVRLEDLGDEVRANTKAVLSVLDRLEPGTS